MTLGSSTNLAFAVLINLALSTAVIAQATEVQSKQLERITAGARQPSFSGIYPHLASFNSEGECGIGAVVTWADRLWWITYSPHKPRGSDDHLYAMTSDLDLYIWPGSIGGTPANRMIHRETNQLLLGPYVIDGKGNIRAISYQKMTGRLTGTARHLTDPANKVYYATMEEGFYEVDLQTLAVKELYPDGNTTKTMGGSLLPGYHGKGLFSGQGRLVYANNGEHSRLAKRNPEVESGVLAEWRGEGEWTVVRRNQFTEVTGPGGIRGNEDPQHDPLWSVGWDHRSLILQSLVGGVWKTYRLPKTSHCYDGAHGWNTEWPRIREVGEDDLLMTMHGAFWRFPRKFGIENSQGIEQRSTYLKVIADFCRYGDKIVFACDDAAKNEFLNTRKAKGHLAGPGESQSNLWFVEPQALDSYGPRLGRGAVWLKDPIIKGIPSEAYLFSGFDHRSAHLAHDAGTDVTFRFEVHHGDEDWQSLSEVIVPSTGYKWHGFGNANTGTWIRVVADRDCTGTVWFEGRDQDTRSLVPDTRFEGLVSKDKGSVVVGGQVHAGMRTTGLELLTSQVKGEASNPGMVYVLQPDLKFRQVEDAAKKAWMIEHTGWPEKTVVVDGHSILYVDDSGRRYRLPIGNPQWLNNGKSSELQRVCREAVTERDLFHCAGTFYELPARNAGGFAKLRPISTHPFFIQDYASWRGMLVLTGIDKTSKSSHVLRSNDGKARVWMGTVDDLWSLGKARGMGGPWTQTAITAGVASDPFLMAGFDRKRLELSHDSSKAMTVHIEVDISGTEQWMRFKRIEVPSGEKLRYEFPRAFAAYWVRLVADDSCRATALFTYN